MWWLFSRWTSYILVLYVFSFSATLNKCVSNFNSNLTKFNIYILWDFYSASQWLNPLSLSLTTTFSVLEFLVVILNPTIILLISIMIIIIIFFITMALCISWSSVYKCIVWSLLFAHSCSFRATSPACLVPLHFFFCKWWACCWTS